LFDDVELARQIAHSQPFAEFNDALEKTAEDRVNVAGENLGNWTFFISTLV
jgi:hypothetical protein